MSENAKTKKKKKVAGVWGIDIGQCSLKALRCVLDGDQIVAEAFDHIEYPKLLSQPEANAEELVAEALETFISRNDLKFDRVAISVPGQSGLCKFFKPPPVDAKRIPDIVKYEAKQQIPFPLDEVIWDFQKLAGGQEVDGFALETEVGLFAMKRDQVFRALQPFQKAGIEPDIIQLAPLTIYNFIAHDILTEGDPDLYNADDPPESLIVLSMGTDATDLVITNGFRLWQRSIPLGGNHFTKQLTKDLKLTFAKAEHLKRNARQAEDPKTIFQAMRPVFNDLVTEVQRSVGFFQSIDRKAKINGMVMLGNTIKLPGLQQYLAKNLGYEAVEFKQFSRLTGSNVISAPAFKDNIYSFGVSYGLCLQGLGVARMGTNLVPQEILFDRLVRSKKPWAVAGVGSMMLASVISGVFWVNSWYKVQDEYASNEVSWKNAKTQVDQLVSTSKGHQDQHTAKVNQLAQLRAISEHVVGDKERRLLWLELMKAINEGFPKTPGLDPGKFVSWKKWPLEKRQEFYIEHIESEYFPKLETWFTDAIKLKYLETRAESTVEETPSGATSPTQQSTTNATPNVPGMDKLTALKGPGWVVEIKGYHCFNADPKTAGISHVKRTLLKFLEDGAVHLPGDGDKPFTMKELGVSLPMVVEMTPIQKTRIENPEYKPPENVAVSGSEGGSERPGSAFGGGGNSSSTPETVEDPDNPSTLMVPKFGFTIQFCWQETPRKLRQERREAAQKLEDEKKKLEEQRNPTPPVANPPKVAMN